MSLELDTRQRAMLQEMGVTVWLPAAEPEVDEDVKIAIQNIAVQAINTPASAEKQAPNHGNSRAEAAVQAVPTPASAPRPAPVAAKATPAPLVTQLTPLAPLPAGLDGMDWASLQQAAATCQACHLGSGRKNSVFGTLPDAAAQADWLIVGDPPTEGDEAQGEPFTDESAVLLANMLKAIGLDVTTQVALTNATKCRTAGLSTGAQELAQCEAYLRRQVALTQPRMILAMGRYAAQALLAQTVGSPVPPLGQLRGTVRAYQGIPVVVTYATANLLRNPADKAKAWADLCLAKAALQNAV
ncbi:MAG: uracil-DNA glycosylase [Burkholderiaceae bacterium]|nr:uracil-DNA glycosylase [Burkholderiaceae bacterium]